MYKKREKIKIIIKAIREGNLLYPALNSAGISPSTFELWRKANPRLTKLYEHARRLSDVRRVQIVEDALLKTAKDGNPTAQIFFLSNRAPDKWKRGDFVKVGVHVEQHNNNNPLKNLKDEELDEIIARR